MDCNLQLMKNRRKCHNWVWSNMRATIYIKNTRAHSHVTTFALRLRRKKTKKPWFNLSDRSRNNRIIVHCNEEKMRQPLRVRLISWFSNPNWGEAREDSWIFYHCDENFSNLFQMKPLVHRSQEMHWFISRWLT